MFLQGPQRPVLSRDFIIGTKAVSDLPLVVFRSKGVADDLLVIAHDDVLVGVGRVRPYDQPVAVAVTGAPRGADS